MIALLVTVLYFGALGAGTAALLGSLMPLSAAARCSRFFLLGLAANGIAVYLIGLAGWPLHPVTFALLGAAGAAAALILRRRLRNDGAPPPSSKIATIALITPIILVSFDATFIPLQDYDGRAFWVLKSRAIAHEQSIDGPFFRGETSRNLHSHYPLLAPGAGAAVMSLTDDLDDRQVRWIYVFAFGALLFLLRDRLSDLAGPTIGTWTVAAMAWLPQLVIELEGSARSAYADIPLGAFTAAAFFDLLQRPIPRSFPIWIAALVLTKNEGVVIAAVLCALAIITGRNWRAVLYSTAPLLLTFAALALWRSRVPLEYDENYTALFPQFAAKMDRLIPAAKAFFRYTADWRHWGVFWVAAGSATAISLRRRETRLALALAAPVIAFYIAAYAVSDWVIPDLARASANRLLTHLLGPAAAGLALGAAGLAKTLSDRDTSNDSDPQRIY
jgi:hypothetical protein